MHLIHDIGSLLHCTAPKERKWNGVWMEVVAVFVSDFHFDF